jgi:hypothetical protein
LASAPPIVSAPAGAQVNAAAIDNAAAIGFPKRRPPNAAHQTCRTAINAPFFSGPIFGRAPL